MGRNDRDGNPGRRTKILRRLRMTNGVRMTSGVRMTRGAGLQAGGLVPTSRGGMTEYPLRVAGWHTRG
jgi:hypothetical protein